MVGCVLDGAGDAVVVEFYGGLGWEEIGVVDDEVVVGGGGVGGEMVIGPVVGEEGIVVEVVGAGVGGLVVGGLVLDAGVGDVGGAVDLVEAVAVEVAPNDGV